LDWSEDWKNTENDDQPWHGMEYLSAIKRGWEILNGACNGTYGTMIYKFYKWEIIHCHV
jgi:hypothetical protein